jgi:SDR family mycofactocin-dependent oxidoreductase
MGKVEGKVALITGAGRGMGASHAEVLAREGADVVLLDVPSKIPTAEYAMSSTEDLERTVAAVEQHDRRAIAVEGDVRSLADLRKAVAQGISEFGKIDFLVANAGIWGQLAPITEMTDEAWQETLDINLTGVWHSVKAVAAHMIERGEGAIVLIASISGLEGQALSANYSSAKHGVIGLMRSTALELGPHNIRCNAICPGFIDTPIHHWQGAYDLLAGHEGGTAADRAAAARFYGILKGRGPLNPVHVSNAVLFLLSEDSGEITGHELPVDSGHMVLPHFNPAPV